MEKKRAEPVSGSSLLLAKMKACDSCENLKFSKMIFLLLSDGTVEGMLFGKNKQDAGNIILSENF